MHAVFVTAAEEPMMTACIPQSGQGDPTAAAYTASPYHVGGEEGTANSSSRIPLHNQPCGSLTDLPKHASHASSGFHSFHHLQLSLVKIAFS